MAIGIGLDDGYESAPAYKLLDVPDVICQMIEIDFCP
jgi:hypothetical protein